MIPRKIHFIGIGGAGMSAVAKLLIDSGSSVTGSDEAVYPPISDFLKAEHIPYVNGYAAANIPANTDAIVIGKNAKLVPETNDEVRAAYASGKPIFSFPEILAMLTKGKEVIVVAGSYGKSTCASLLTHVLMEQGKDPSYFIGAVPLTPPTSAHRGQSPFFVIEGDEYPSSNTDPRAKFSHYKPKHVLLVPLAHDHVNVYPTIEDYLRPFIELSSQPETFVACTEGPLSAAFVESLKRPMITYGLNKGDYKAGNISWGETTSFDLLHRSRPVVRITTSQLGEHSIQNIVGVGAFILSLKAMSPEAFAKAVASFKGVKRRLDRKSEKTSLPIFEGFGSSYEKARSAIAAVKQHFPDRRLVVVFEPHAFSWRNREAIGWYDTAFEGAEVVFVYEPATQGATTHAQLSKDEIVERVEATGIRTMPLPPKGSAVLVAEEFQANDVVLLLTSGALGGLIEELPALAEKLFPA